MNPLWGDPVVDVHPQHVEVWWRPLPDPRWHYRVVRDRWDYAHEGKPVRFIYEISQG